MQPWYKKKKILVAIAGAVAKLAGDLTDKPELGDHLMALAGVLIMAIGAEDFGKAAKTADAARPSMPPPEAFDAAAKATVPDQPAAKRKV